MILGPSIVHAVHNLHDSVWMQCIKGDKQSNSKYVHKALLVDVVYSMSDDGNWSTICSKHQEARLCNNAVSTCLPVLLTSFDLSFFIRLTVGGLWRNARKFQRQARSQTGLHRTCSWWITIYMGKPSAVGQSTKANSAFHPHGVDKWVYRSKLHQ